MLLGCGSTNGERVFDHQFFNATGEDHFLESKANVLQLRTVPTPSIIAKGLQQ